MVDLDAINWLSPSDYPTRPRFDLNLAVARDIAQGASWRAVAKKYGIYARFRDWMLWGYEAAQRDANATDHHALYLDFYLKVGQALGLVETEVQQGILANEPKFWLLHNPETAGEWASARDIGSAIVAESVMLPAVEEAAPAAAEVAGLSATTLREALQTAIKAGAAVPAPEGEVVEGSVTEAEGSAGNLPPDWNQNALGDGTNG